MRGKRQDAKRYVKVQSPFASLAKGPEYGPKTAREGAYSGGRRITRRNIRGTTMIGMARRIRKSRRAEGKPKEEEKKGELRRPVRMLH